MGLDYALATLSEIRTFPGLSSVEENASNDAILDALIDSATTDFEAYWNTNGVRRSVTERHNYKSIVNLSRNADKIYLRKPPVVPSGITITDPAGNTIDSDDYWVDEDAGVLHTTGVWNIPQNDAGFQTFWTIVYTGGWAVNTAGVPASIKTAVKMRVANLYQRPDKSVIRKKIGDFELGYRDTKDEPDLPIAVKALIEPWRIISV